MDGYIRVSRTMGRKGAGYISPDVQRESIQRWADYNGVRIAAWHEDYDESGGTQNRPGLRACMRRIEATQTRGLICWRVDRFARNVGPAEADIELIRQHGARIAFSDENLDTSGPMGEYLLTNLLAMARLQREQLSKGWETARGRAVERGAFIGKPPVGYRKIRDKNHPRVGALSRPRTLLRSCGMHTGSQRATGSTPRPATSKVACPAGGQHFMPAGC